MAAVVAANGFVSLLTGLEVLPVVAAGPLAVPIGVAVAAAVMAIRAARATATSTLLPVELLLLGWLVPIAGATLVALLSGLDAALLTAARLVTSPFAAAEGVLAGICGLILLVLVRASDAGAGPPRWPWEKEEDDGV